MKKQNMKLFLFLLSSLCIASCTEKKEGFTLNGTLKDAGHSMVYLKCYKDGNFTDVDSAVVENGKFSFSGTASAPMAYALTTVKENRRPMVLFMGNDNVNVVMNESEKSMTVTGSSENDIYTKADALLKQDALNIDSLVSANPASVAAAYIFVRNFASRMDYSEVKSIRDKFDVSLNGNEYVAQTDDLLARLESLKNGAEAPDFTLPDADGNPVSLSSFRGKYVLIDFWASWCPDCRVENPNIVAAYNEFKDKNFTVLGVSLDRKKEAWLNAIEKDGLTWTHVCDFKDWNSEVAATYVIKWIPKNYLVGPDSKIIASGLEGEELSAKLREILK